MQQVDTLSLAEACLVVERAEFEGGEFVKSEERRAREFPRVSATRMELKEVYGRCEDLKREIQG